MIEAYTPEDVLRALLGAAGNELVLVGGQALAYWMGRYDLAIGADVPAVSRDVDFLVADAGDREPVRRMARALRGRDTYPVEQALTAIVGQAIRPVSDAEYLNVDLISKVIGLDEKVVRSGAMAVRSGALMFRVMHPLDVLASRLHNLYRLPEKQNELGMLQLRCAIRVVRAAHHEVPAVAGMGGRPALLSWARAIEQLARIDAGRKVAQRHGIHVADAIEVEAIDHANFRSRKLPRLLPLMSAQRAGELSDLLVASTPAAG